MLQNQIPDLTSDPEKLKTPPPQHDHLPPSPGLLDSEAHHDKKVLSARSLSDEAHRGDLPLAKASAEAAEAQERINRNVAERSR
jgi:hypothetical protein